MKVSLKAWYTLQELVELKLPGLPTSKQGMQVRAHRCKWPSRPHTGPKGGREYPLALVLFDVPAEEMTEELRQALRVKLEELQGQIEVEKIMVARITRLLQRRAVEAGVKAEGERVK